MRLSPARAAGLFGQAVAWAVVVPLTIFTVVYLLHLDDSTLVIVLQTATSYLYLPAYAAFAVGVGLRRRLLALMAAVLIFFHLLFMLPGMPRASELSAQDMSSPRLRIYTHNVLYKNETPELIAEGIRRTSADIVFLQEVSPRILGLLRSRQALAPYPYEYVRLNTGSTGLALFSRYPLTEKRILRGPGFPLMLASVDVSGTPITLVNVHTQAPVAGDPAKWKGDLELIERTINATPGKVIVAGDFNATWYNQPFRRLLSERYLEAHMERGRGYVRTWPVDRPLGRRTEGWIRIDHVLASSDLRFLAVREEPGQGSDHRGIVTEIAILPK